MYLNKKAAFKSFFKLELKALLREPVSLFFMIVLPIVLTIVFGGAFGSEPTMYGEKVLGIDTVVPINIVFLAANVGLMGIPITIIELKEQEVLKRYLTYPINAHNYFIALVAVFLCVSIISTFIFGAISFIVYGAKWYMGIGESILFLLLYLTMVFVFDVLGFMIALLIKSSRSANMITSGAFLVLIFTSGIALPLDALPAIVQKIAYILPMSHYIEIIQLLWISEFNIIGLWDHITYIVVISLVMILIIKNSNLVRQTS